MTDVRRRHAAHSGRWATRSASGSCMAWNCCSCRKTQWLWRRWLRAMSRLVPPGWTFCNRAFSRSSADLFPLPPFSLPQLKQDALEKEQQITSLQRKVALHEETIDSHESKLAEYKNLSHESDQHKTSSDNLTRKVQMLEEELERSEKELKETKEQYKTVEIKAEHFQKSLERLTQERDEMERKYDEALARLEASKKELEQLVSEMEGLVSLGLMTRSA